MVLAALLLSGAIAISVLPIDALPEIQVPRVQVSASYPGLAARDIRTVLTIPIEDALASVRSLQRIRSISRDGESVLVLDFAWGTDPKEGALLVREAIDAVYPQLPEGASRPLVIPADSSNQPIGIVAVRSRRDGPQLARHLAEYELRSRFRRIEGIGMVLLVGGQKQEIRVQLDPERSFFRGLGAASFADLLGSEWADVSAGSAREGNQELVIVSAGKPKALDELSRRVLPARSGPVYPAEVGQVSLAYRDRESLFVADGQEAVALELYRRARSNPLEVARQIRSTVEEAQKDLGRDVELVVVYDGSESTRKGLMDLGRSALFGAMAVVAALLFFIRSLRGSLLTLFSLPMAASASLASLALTGKSLNSMSLGGLALGIGLVSDTSVLILELMERHYGRCERGKIPREALADLVASVSTSSLGSTLTTLIVFIPILFLPGPLGALFADLSVALVAAVAAGWAYAQFALPSLYRSWGPKTVLAAGSSGFAAPQGPHVRSKDAGPSNVQSSRPGFVRLHRSYRRLLRIALRHPFRLWTIAAASLLLGTLLLLGRPVRFSPTEGAEELELILSFPPGMRLDAMVSHGEALSRLVHTLPEIKAVFGRAGAEPEDILHRVSPDYRKELLRLRCILQEGAAAQGTLPVLISNVQAYVDEKAPPGLTFRLAYPEDPIETLLGLSSSSTVALKAENPETLQSALETSLTLLAARNPGASFSSRPSGKRTELSIRLKRDMAATARLSTLSVAKTLLASTEGVPASRMEMDGRPIDIRVQAQLDMAHPIQSLRALPVNEGGPAPLFLGSLAALERTEGPAALARLDRSDVVYIDGTAAPGQERALAQALQRASQDLPGLSYADESAFRRYRQSLLCTVLLVILLLYLLMAAQFESYGLPVLLMMSIPFALSGAGPALALAGSGLDSGSIIGLAVLFGLVVNNAIILYEVSKEQVDRGLAPSVAVYTGASQRLIPVLATTATTLLALLPVILSPLGATQRSMAAAMFGGLAASTLITLLLIPPVLARCIKGGPHVDG